MPGVTYDQHYRDDPSACGEPFTEAPPGSVLDLGCGQGRDALMFARAGHRVVGVDVSSVGVEQMLATARSEHLDVHGVVCDIRTYRPETTFDIVVLDRVLHMLDPEDRLPVLATAMQAVTPGGRLLVAEGPKGMAVLREAVTTAGWTLTKSTRNRLVARRPGG
ncbi:MAG: class I SAM-dependent methyltransferase [Alphaproteobacteria bacterium]|nr:class I SAM-dependent methyltransferase [Alphaproteobacteria bacterium]MCB9694785.1 class I SAM-dependent methyltransferase [Alphaproteobacteria bacterium]